MVFEDNQIKNKINLNLKIIYFVFLARVKEKYIWTYPQMITPKHCVIAGMSLAPISSELPVSISVDIFEIIEELILSFYKE